MTKPHAPLLVFAMLAVLILGLVPDRTAHAAGRTYVPQYIKDDKKKRNRRTESCRLVRLDRNEEDKNMCVYQRQSGGFFNYALEDSVHCQRELQCPMVTKEEQVKEDEEDEAYNNSRKKKF